MLKHFSRPPCRCIATPLLLLGALVGSACGSTDGSRLLQPGGGYGGVGSGGVAGGGRGGASGTGGSGGTAELSDAGPDATSDASSSAPSCVAGPLDQYCAFGAGFCPATYAEARAKSHETVLTARPRLILQQTCSAPDGSQRIRVGTIYYEGSLSRSYIFNPSGERLVSVSLVDDLGGCADGPGSPRGFYGEDLPGCLLDYSDFHVPAECDLPPDAGATLDAGADAGTGPYECILAP